MLMVGGRWALFEVGRQGSDEVDVVLCFFSWGVGRHASR